jgi:hypothetical protein
MYYFFVIYSIPGVIKQYGSHLKASAAMVRLRLYDVLSLLPPETFEGRFISTYIDWTIFVYMYQVLLWVRVRVIVFNATFQQYFSYIVVIRFIWWRKSKYPEKTQTCHRSLTSFITYCCIGYTSPWAGFELTPLMKINIWQS